MVFRICVFIHYTINWWAHMVFGICVGYEGNWYLICTPNSTQIYKNGRKKKRHSWIKCLILYIWKELKNTTKRLQGKVINKSTWEISDWSVLICIHAHKHCFPTFYFLFKHIFCNQPKGGSFGINTIRSCFFFT